jgi:hypothetical protein
MRVLERFCRVDDFWLALAPAWQQTLLHRGQIKRQRSRSLAERDIMPILIHVHQSPYRDFTACSSGHGLAHLHAQFPGPFRSSRFVHLIPSVLFPLAADLETGQGQWNALSLVESTRLVAGHNRRIKQHRVFAGLAQRGKDALEWFYGFKRPLRLNDAGERLACRRTPGQGDDRRPLPQLAQGLFGNLLGEKGDRSKDLGAGLLERGVELLTPIKGSMRPRRLRLNDKLLWRKRVLIEPSKEQLKNISPIDHRRHRSPAHVLVTVLAGLLAACHPPKKPSLQVSPEILALISH